MKTAVEIRALTLSDLNGIDDIEHRSYDTPWSRSMFAGELAKPASLCLGAFEGEQLGGYLIVSRYVDAWHIMNIAVSPDFRRRGIATALLERLFELTDDRQPARLHARGARVERRRDQVVRASRLHRARHQAGLLHRQPGGRADHVAGARRLTPA